MPTEIKRHAFDRADALDTLGFMTTLVPNKLEQVREDIDNLTDLADAACQHACLAAALKPREYELHRLYVAAARCATAPFVLARADKLIHWPLFDETPEPLSGRVAPSMVSLPSWLDAVSLALIARDAMSISALAAVTAEQLNAWHPLGAAHEFALIEAWSALLVPWSDPQRAILQCFEQATHGKLDAEQQDYTNLIQLPVLAVLARIAQRDSKATTTAVIEALQSHRDYVATPNRRQRPPSLVSLPVSAAVALAMDLGLPLDVTSDYLVLPAPAADDPVTACAYCSAPVVAQAQRCPVCLQTTGDDAPLEVTLASLRAGGAKHCRACSHWMLDMAVVCPACRTRQ